MDGCMFLLARVKEKMTASHRALLATATPQEAAWMDGRGRKEATCAFRLWALQWLWDV